MLGSDLRTKYCSVRSAAVETLGMRIMATLMGGWLALALPAQVSCGHAFHRGLELPGAAGTVACSTWWDPDGSGPQTGRLVVAGEFTAIGGVPANGIASFDPTSDAWSMLGSGLVGTPNVVISALLGLPTGRLLAGGLCTLPGGQPQNAVVQWDGSQWRTLGTGVTGVVTGLARMGNGDIVAAGQLWVGPTSQRTPIAIWDGNAWSIPGSGITPDYTTVRIAQLTNGDVLVIGQFTAPYPGRAVWNGTTWSPAPTLGNGFVDGTATAPNGDLVVTGTFTAIGGTLVNGIARWDGQNWSALGAGLVLGSSAESVAALTFLGSGDLVLAGSFTQIAGIPAANVARWDGTAWTALGDGIQDPLQASLPYPLAVATLTTMPNGRLFAGGRFSMAGDVVTCHMATWDGGEWTAVSGGVNDAVLALQTLRNGDVVAGGLFTVLGSGMARAIAQWDGTTWRALGSGMRGGLGATSCVAAMIERTNGDLVAAGDFATAGGVSAANVALWNGTAWSSLGSGLGGGTGFGAPADCLVELTNGDIVVGGWFTTAGGMPANGIARWDGVAWAPLGTGVSGVPYPKVSTMVVLPNGDLVAAGSFLFMDGLPANHIARWNGTQWLPLGNGLGTDPWTEVGDLLVRDGELVAVGSFASAGGVAAPGIARWDGSSWSTFGAAPPGLGHAIESAPNGDLIVAGAMQSGSELHALARWDGSAWHVGDSRIGDITTTPAPHALALAIAPDGGVHFGGAFWFTGNYRPTPYLAQIASTCPALALQSGAGCSGSAGPVALRSAALPWLGATHTALAAGVPTNSLALVGFGLQSIALPLGSLLAQGGAGCTLLVSPDLLMLQVPTNGVVMTSLAIPDVATLIGLMVGEQVLVAELDAAGALTSVVSSNALALTIGVF